MSPRDRFPLELIDVDRGPTASQAAGLSLAVVVDAGDQMVAFERVDGADLAGITLARDKAFTALVNRMPT